MLVVFYISSTCLSPIDFNYGLTGKCMFRLNFTCKTSTLKKSVMNSSFCYIYNVCLFLGKARHLRVGLWDVFSVIHGEGDYCYCGINSSRWMGVISNSIPQTVWCTKENHYFHDCLVYCASMWMLMFMTCTFSVLPSIWDNSSTGLNQRSKNFPYINL